MLKLKTTKPDLKILAKNVGDSTENIWFIASSAAFADFSGILKDKRGEFYFVQGKMRSGILTIEAHRMFDSSGYIIKQESKMFYEFNDTNQDLSREAYSIAGNVIGEEGGKRWGPEIRVLSTE